MNLKTLIFGETPLAVARSLRDEPDRWSARRFLSSCERWAELEHDSGTVLWTGSDAFGMGVQAPGAAMWGGITALSIFGLGPGHWLLRIAADRWIRDHAPAVPGLVTIPTVLCAPSPSGGE